MKASRRYRIGPKFYQRILLLFAVIVVIASLLTATCSKKQTTSQTTETMPTDDATATTSSSAVKEVIVPVSQTIEVAGPIVYRNEFPAYIKWDEEDVKKIQTALGITASGQFESETGNAVHNYQNRKGLGVDGVVGVYTLKKLGITELRSQSNLRYVANLEFIAEKSTSDYLIYTSVFSRKIAVYHRDDKGYWKCIIFADCGVGKNSSMTPLGENVINRKMLAIPYGDDTYRCYITFFSGDYGIHSTSCTTVDPATGRFDNIEQQIGRKITLGGIQVEPEIAKFIYDNCGNGTIVVRDDRDLKDYDPLSINP